MDPRATIDFVAFNTLVENIRIGRTGTAFILNSKGIPDPAARKHPSTSVFHAVCLRQGAESAPPTMGDELLGGSDVVMRQSGTDASRAVFETGSYLGRSLFMSWCLSSPGSDAGFQQDAYDAFSELLKARYLAIFINVFGGLGIIATALVLSRKMVRFIERRTGKRK
jgi:two-component system NtrC family sensor kinase